MLTPALFPGGRGAAVCMTYDDGCHEHLDHAIVDLDAAGLRGTFYIPTMKAPAWPGRIDQWRAAGGRGHELGNHTRFHPCSISHNWVKPNFSLEAYSLARMESELVQANQELDAACDPAHRARTYAYTCCQDYVGPERTSYRPTVARLFPAARGGGEALSDAMTVDLAFVPSLAVHPHHSAEELIGHVQRAIELGKWCVFMFHGVGGGHRIDCPRPVHQALCRHIAANADRIWCDTFLNVAQHIRTATDRRWEPGG